MKTTGRRLATVSRLLLGIVFLAEGVDGFLHVLPKPPMPPDAAAFVGALVATGYLFPLLKGVELAAGAMLLSGRLVPLALAMLAPILVNIAAFHAFLAPAGTGLAALLLALELHLAWHHREAFAPMLSRRAGARASDARVRRGAALAGGVEAS